jgi:hypothetical protein
MQAIWIITRKGSGKFVGAFEYEHDAVAMKEALQDHDAAEQDNRDLEVSWVWLQSATQPAAPQEGQQAKPQSKVGQYISCQTCHKPAGDQATKESGTCHDCKAQIVREGRQREANRANLRAHLAANS